MRDPIPKERQAIFNRGHKVGHLAQQLFPGGKDASPPKRFAFAESVAMTKRFIESGETVIYEAAFQHEQVLVLLDILVKRDDKWYAYEVKSSSRITPTYIKDAALQHWVITNSGLPLEDFSIVYINKHYVRNGQLDLEQLYTKVSVLHKILPKQEKIPQKVWEMKEVVFSDTMPKQPIGPHCSDPYDCDFRGFCWPKLPAHPIFELTGASRKEQFSMYAQGIDQIANIPDSVVLSREQKIQKEAVVKGKPVIQKKPLQQFMKSLQYPLHVTDFEVFMPAIPLYNNTSPYQHLPFQYSILRLNDPQSEGHQTSFLAEAGEDPRGQFLALFLKDTAGDGSILGFDLTLEKSILHKLADQFPEHEADIDDRIARMKDLQSLFDDRAYYHPAMRGRFSLKHLIEAFAPEISEQNLMINNGRLASEAFTQLQTETDMFRAIDIREALIAYCESDTRVMYHLLREIQEAVA